jgi:sodium-dependent phosphate transporter
MIIICAGALVFGLATYGYNVTRAMGVRLAKLSPVRGFAAELATAIVIMVASQVWSRAAFCQARPASIASLESE